MTCPLELELKNKYCVCVAAALAVDGGCWACFSVL